MVTQFSAAKAALGMQMYLFIYLGMHMYVSQSVSLLHLSFLSNLLQGVPKKWWQQRQST